MMENKLNIPQNPLYVPMHVDALVINDNEATWPQKNKTRWKDLSLDVDSLTDSDYKGLGRFVEKDINDSGSPKLDSDNGVHLHWILPKAFRHGVFDKDTNRYNYPVVPNRWLVIRSDKDLNPEYLKSWIIESDCIVEGQAVNWIDNANADEFRPVHIGKCTELTEDWSDQTEESVQLTIMAVGAPEFAASYRHCKNIFGLHDKLEGVNKGTDLSYRVFGWYANQKDDPLDEKNRNNLKVFLEASAWQYQGVPLKDLEEDKIPQRILCHGNSFQLKWNNEVPFRKPSDQHCELAIGNSTSEALAVLLKDKIADKHKQLAKNLMVAFQYHSLHENGIQDKWTDAMYEKIHQSSFTTTASGKIWVIEHKEEKQVGEESQQKISTPDFPEEVSDLLFELNRLQQDYNEKWDSLRSLQEQLHALMFKYTFSGTDYSGIPSERKEEILDLIQEKIEEQKVKIRDLRAELLALKSMPSSLSTNHLYLDEIDNFAGLIPAAYDDLIDQMERCAEIKQYAFLKHMELKEILMPAYYEAKDPIILINGLEPSENYTDEGSIRCRTSDQFSESIKIPYEEKTYSVSAKELISSEDFLAKIPTNLHELFKESLLFDPNSAKKMADLHSGLNRDRFINTIKTLLKEEKKPENFDREKETITLPEEFCIAAWHQPWIPLYLEWQVRWYSSYTEYDTEAVFEKWNFGQQEGAFSDFQLKAGKIDGSYTECHGRTLLSQGVGNWIEKLNEKLEDPLFPELQPMTQQLNGLGQALLMRKSGVELPLFQLESPWPDTLKIAPDYKEYIGREHLWHPEPQQEGFLPFRAGVFEVVDLQVIDAYGQVLKIVNKNRTENPSAANSVGLPVTLDNRFILTPRILQPTRLRFEWLSALHDDRITDSDPGTNPVCGWLLHNPLNKSIAVFSSDGTAIGELLKNPDGDLIFILPPGREEVPLESIQNTRLRELVTAVKNDPDYFEELIARLDKVTLKASPRASQQSLSMDLPVGLPVALVAARCLLEVKGEPADYQHWDTQKRGFNKNYLENISFDTYLGDEKSLLDGLVGFFTDDNYGKLHLPFKAASYNPVPLKAGCSETISLLMDPRMKVKLSCGILPAASYALPEQFIFASLQAINVGFQVAPVLTPLDQLQLPLQKGPGIKWSWSFIDQNSLQAKRDEVYSIPPSNLTFPPLISREGWLSKLKQENN